MRLGDNEKDYYRQGPTFAATPPADLFEMLAHAGREDEKAGGASAESGGSR